MKTPQQMGRPGPGRAAVEFVGGPHDGERSHYAVEPETMKEPPKVIPRGARGGSVTYVRRERAERCPDGLEAWHYDAQRQETPA